MFIVSNDSSKLIFDGPTTLISLIFLLLLKFIFLLIILKFGLDKSNLILLSSSKLFSIASHTECFSINSNTLAISSRLIFSDRIIAPLLYVLL